MIPLNDPTTLSMLLHLNSEPWLNNEAYRNAIYLPEFKEFESVRARVGLPVVPPSPLSHLIGSRKSTRAFLPKGIPLDFVSALTMSAYGLREMAEMRDGTKYYRRSVPSAGGMFPLEFFLFVQRVDGLSNGLYHYDVRGHALELIYERDIFGELEPVFYTYPFIRDANLVFAMAAMFPRNQKKYGPRGYRYTLLEAGHAGQNICLAAAELGLSSLCMGGFIDSKLNRMLNLRASEEGVVYSVAVGWDAEAGLETHAAVNS
jgi:SagB-type dehydrogenase family enzyme